MNKIGYPPLPVLLRADSGDARASKSAIILRVIATLGTLFTLCGAVAICLIGFNAFPRKTAELRAPADVSLPPETTMSPAATPGHDDSTSALTVDSNQDHRSTITEDRSVLDQTATSALNPTSTPAPAPKAETPASESGQLKEERPEVGRINRQSHLSEVMRKKLEKKRVTAERKRSQLEELYRTGAISSAAYKKGEEKYQREIERYRSEMSARIGPRNDVAGQN